MNIIEYLKRKYNVTSPTTMTYAEAKIFQIPWPLQRGWVATFGNRQISAEQARELKAANERRLGKKAAKSPKTARYAEIAVGVAVRAEKRAQPTKARVAVESAGFLQSYEWRRLRLEAFKAYGRKCQCCGSTPATGAILNVDHIKPRAVFPELALSLSNLQVLCHECNHGKGNWDMTDFRTTETNG